MLLKNMLTINFHILNKNKTNNKNPEHLMFGIFIYKKCYFNSVTLTEPSGNTVVFLASLP